MRSLSYLAFFSLIVHLLLGSAAAILDRRSRLNRAYLVLCALNAIWSLGRWLVYAEVNFQVDFFAARLSAFGWALFPPAMLNLAFVISGVPRKRMIRAVILGLTNAASLLILAAALTDDSFIQAVPYTSVGNVTTHDQSGWFLFYLIFAYSAFMVLIGLILYSRGRSTSRRYRRLALTIALTYFICLPLNVIMNFFLPPLWHHNVIIGVISAAGTFYAIARFRFMRPAVSLVEQQTFLALEDAVILVDGDLRTLKVNQAAEALLLGRSIQQSPVNLAGCFSNTETIRSEWQYAIRERKKGLVKDAWMDGQSFQLTLIPLFDHFYDLIGGTVIARPNNLLDSAITRFGITARERQIALKLMLGYSNSEIAEAFSIALSTVKSHVHNIYAKTGAANRVELGRFFLTNDGTAN